MQIAQLSAFHWAARLGSFTAAAQQLGIAQPSVSELVKRLESEIGLRLFVRSGRRLTLTAAGDTLQPWAERLDNDLAAARRAMEELRGIRGGVASFGLLRNASFYFLSDLAARFHREHPGVQIRLVGQNSVGVAEAVRDGSLEAGFVVLPIDADGLDVTPIVRDRVLWASADPSRVDRPFPIEKVADRPLILYDAHYGWADPTRRQLRDLAERHGIALQPSIEVENVDAALELVAQGVGDTIVSGAVARHPMFPAGVHTGELAEPLFDTIALITRDGAVLSPVTRELVRVANEMLMLSDLPAA